MTAGETAAAAIASIFASALGWYLVLVESAATGFPTLDGYRWQIALRLFTNLSPQIEDMRACVAILHNEHGSPGHDIHDPMELGDVDLPVGPSIGPFQVYRKTAIDYGLWTPQGATDEDDRAAYTALGSDPANEGTLIGWGVQVYLAKKSEANGLIWGNDGAVRRYNGRGDGARTYANAAATFAQIWSPA